ncbi:MAG: protein kinase domain-containing protein [Acidobacteriota bacterium]
MEDTDLDDVTSATRADNPRSRERVVAREQAASARLGHFHLLEPIGRGGMGTVYSAYDLRLDRKVAIKLLEQHDASAELRPQRNQRLLREAQAMAKLSHPNVVPIFEVGLDGERLFIAMEYVAGETLAKWLQTKRTWREIVGVFAQAGRGLAAAHEAGIIHRDFKPANVLVDAKGHVRVTDFGIALVGPSTDSGDDLRSSESSIDSPSLHSDLTPPSTSTPLTEAGALVGTPAYMSPEQLKRSPIDARSDQFSFCVALYEALFGKRPFPGRGKEYKRQVTRGEIAKPDPKAAVPGWVTALVMRGLSADPDARFPSMTALVDALARDPSRRRKQLALAGGALVAIAGAAIVAGWQLSARRGAAEQACSGAAAELAGAWDDGVRAQLERAFAASGAPYADASAKAVEAVLDRYRADWIAMRTDACRATRVREEQSEHVLDLRIACLDRREQELRALTSLLAAGGDAHHVEKAVEAASALTPLAGCADTTALLAPNAEPTDPALRARRDELRGRLARLVALDHLGRSKEAREPANALVADARASGDPRMLAEALALRGELETKANDFKAAGATYEEALRAARDTGDTALLARTTVELADSLSGAGISAAREGLGVVRVARPAVDAARDPALAIRTMIVEARLQGALAHRELALPLLRDAEQQCRAKLPHDATLLRRIQYELAWSLANSGQAADARAVYDALIASATKELGALHPMTLSARLDSCAAYVRADDNAHAQTCFEATLADADRVLGPSDRTVLQARLELAEALLDAQQLDRAREVFATALDHVPADAWDERWYVAGELARGLGRTELKTGHPADAIPHCRRAYDHTEEKHRGISDMTCIGRAQLALGDAAAALATLEPLAAQTGSEMIPGVVAEWHFAYARALWAARHDAAKARAHAEQARAELDDKREVDAFLASLPR